MVVFLMNFVWVRLPHMNFKHAIAQPRCDLLPAGVLRNRKSPDETTLRTFLAKYSLLGVLDFELPLA